MCNQSYEVQYLCCFMVFISLINPLVVVIIINFDLTRFIFYVVSTFPSLFLIPAFIIPLHPLFIFIFTFIVHNSSLLPCYFSAHPLKTPDLSSPPPILPTSTQTSFLYSFLPIVFQTSFLYPDISHFFPYTSSNTSHLPQYFTTLCVEHFHTLNIKPLPVPRFHFSFFPR